MMKILAVLLPLLGCLVALLIFMAFYGGFYPVRFSTEKCGGELLLYKEWRGDYRKTGAVMDEIYYKLLDNGIETKLGCGIFYDDPRYVPAQELRSEAGCIIPSQYYDKLDQIEAKFQLKKLPSSNYLCAEFPYKNQFSIFIASFKIYPALEKYLQKQQEWTKGAVIEIYDQPSGKIYYRIELEKKTS